MAEDEFAVELLLNLVWATVALAALSAFWLQQRTHRESSKVSYLKASVALATLLIVLFPVISVSDDFHPAMAALDEPAKRLSLVAALLHHAQDGPSTVLLAAMLALQISRAPTALRDSFLEAIAAGVVMRARVPDDGRSPPRF